MDPQKLPLRDIHLPEPVSWWPPAPGWWLVLALVIGLAALAVWLYRRPRRAKAPRRLALRELERISRDYAVHRDPQRLAVQLSVLLRRTAISLFPRAEAAGLTGEAWLVYLDGVLRDGRFTQGVGRQLASAPYSPATDVDAEALLSLCRDWIEGLPNTRPLLSSSAAPEAAGGAERRRIQPSRVR